MAEVIHLKILTAVFAATYLLASMHNPALLQPILDIFTFLFTKGVYGIVSAGVVSATVGSVLEGKGIKVGPLEVSLISIAGFIVGLYLFGF